MNEQICEDCGETPCTCHWDWQCWHCGERGRWEDAGVRVIRETRIDPEERYATCPKCGRDVEEIDG